MRLLRTDREDEGPEHFSRNARSGESTQDPEPVRSRKQDNDASIWYKTRGGAGK